MPFVANARQLMARPSIRLLAPVIALLLCFCGILAYVMAEARRATLESAREASTSLNRGVIIRHIPQYRNARFVVAGCGR